jgi:hypothetical protein
LFRLKNGFFFRFPDEDPPPPDGFEEIVQSGAVPIASGYAKRGTSASINRSMRANFGKSFSLIKV